MADMQMPNTAAQIGQAATMKKYNDIPIDVLPDNSFARLYKPGQRTLKSKELDEDTRQYDMSLQEEKRAKEVAEALAQKEYDEMVRSNKADESYKWAALNRSGSGGGGGSTKAPTAAETLNAIRSGAIDFAQRQMKVIPYNAEAPYNAVQATKQLLNSQLADLGISPTQYNDIINSVSLAVGYQEPAKTTSSANDSDALRTMLGLSK